MINKPLEDREPCRGGGFLRQGWGRHRSGEEERPCVDGVSNSRGSEPRISWVRACGGGGGGLERGKLG